MSGTVAIVGRPNVGKSTLFNRLIRQRRAIVDDVPGVTRDRLYGESHWLDRDFTVIDTGGYVPDSADVFDAGIREQVEIALEEADVVLFAVDGQMGIMPQDEEFAQIIRRLGLDERVLLVVNKVDNPNQQHLATEFYSLGFGELYPISANTGGGTGDLLDAVVERLPASTDDDADSDLPRVAIVGRPNVGKSSFVNALAENANNLVTDIAGTTRDSLFTRFEGFGHELVLVDTAGLRKKAKVHENVEYYSTNRTIRAIEHCDVALLMVDAQTGVEAQDLAILRLIQNQKKGMIILANKWDLVEKTRNIDREIIAQIERRIQPLSHVPILLSSVATKHNLVKALDTVAEVAKERSKQISTAQLNRDMQPIIEEFPPPSHRNHFPKIKFMSQVPAKSPTFLFFSSHPKFFKESYTRFLEKQLRELYGFRGWPITIVYKQK